MELDGARVLPKYVCRRPVYPMAQSTQSAAIGDKRCLETPPVTLIWLEMFAPQVGFTHEIMPQVCLADAMPNSVNMLIIIRSDKLSHQRVVRDAP